MREDAYSAMPSARTVAPLELMHGPTDKPCGESVSDELQMMPPNKAVEVNRLPLRLLCFHSHLADAGAQL